MINIKPMLAEDFSEKMLKFPVIGQVKIDGARGLNLDGILIGRKLNPHKNIAVTKKFSGELFKGLDGELAGGEINSSDLCRKTSSILNTIAGADTVTWTCFDYITNETINLPYIQRYEKLTEYVNKQKKLNPELFKDVNVIKCTVINNHAELIAFENWCIKNGYEGVILRDPDGKYKQGRSTVIEGGLLRIKRFNDSEALVLDIIEGTSNKNIKTKNLLGLAKRSSHKANLVNNGTVGYILAKDIKTNKIIRISPGKMTAKERKYYFDNKLELINKIVKYKFFDKGIKDLPKYATFICVRIDSDIEQ